MGCTENETLDDPTVVWKKEKMKSDAVSKCNEYEWRKLRMKREKYPKK